MPKTAPPQPTLPCTIHSPNTRSFFDIRPIALQPLKEGEKAKKDHRTESWHARGWDYNANFTLNICAPVLENLQNVVGVKESLWKNVSAFYELHGKTYSIGQQSSQPIFRGRKLVLNYTDGSPCDTPSKSHKRSSFRHGDDEDEDKKKEKEKHSKGEDDEGPIRRKSTLISLLCDRDPLAPRASAAFVGASPDECAYFFELRSHAACGGVSDAQQTLGPGGVFGVIALIAVLVYLVGGCVYQRTVMHARGWRQLPNYSMWAGIGGFIRDIFLILTSSLSRLIPRSRGYRSLSPSFSAQGVNGNSRRGGNGGRGGNRNDDENRLIDQLDEEWDD